MCQIATPLEALSDFEEMLISLVLVNSPMSRHGHVGRQVPPIPVSVGNVKAAFAWLKANSRYYIDVQWTQEHEAWQRPAWQTWFLTSDQAISGVAPLRDFMLEMADVDPPERLDHGSPMASQRSMCLL